MAVWVRCSPCKPDGLSVHHQTYIETGGRSVGICSCSAQYSSTRRCEAEAGESPEIYRTVSLRHVTVNKLGVGKGLILKAQGCLLTSTHVPMHKRKLSRYVLLYLFTCIEVGPWHSNMSSTTELHT